MDFEPTLAAEKLRTKHGIDLAKETARELPIPRMLRPPKVQHGLVFIDGATSRLMQILLNGAESTFLVTSKH